MNAQPTAAQAHGATLTSTTCKIPPNHPRLDAIAMAISLSHIDKSYFRGTIFAVNWAFVLFRGAKKPLTLNRRRCG